MPAQVCPLGYDIQMLYDAFTAAASCILCTHCSCHKACKCTSLQALFPDIAQEWDDERNTGTPDDACTGVSAGVGQQCALSVSSGQRCPASVGSCIGRSPVLSPRICLVHWKGRLVPSLCGSASALAGRLGHLVCQRLPSRLKPPPPPPPSFLPVCNQTNQYSISNLLPFSTRRDCCFGKKLR